MISYKTKFEVSWLNEQIIELISIVYILCSCNFHKILSRIIWIPVPKLRIHQNKLIYSWYCVDTLSNIFYICYQLLNEKMPTKAIVQQTYLQWQLTFQLQVALLYYGYFFCAGSIVSETCVVTAASCVVGYVCT